MKQTTLFQRIKCVIGYHEGPYIGTGRIIATGKKNKHVEPIGGTWRVHRCSSCHQVYSGPAFRVKGKK